MKTFDESIEVVDFEDASYFAADLFRDCFASAFPVPPESRDTSGKRERTWHQYVAFYKWSEMQVEAVAFCNWIRHDDVYLEGGMCVRPNFYRRLNRDHWTRCKERGGMAQIISEAAARKLDDADAWFGYCGDRKANAVNLRVGYRPTKHEFLIVRWLRELPETQKAELEARIAALGPF